MLQKDMLTIPQVNESISLYFKTVTKAEPDWDKFDEALLQMAMLVMKGEVNSLVGVIDHLDDVVTHF